MTEMKRTDFSEELITAYALGELSATERAEIETRAAQDPALRATIAEVREFASLMSADLAAEPTPSLKVEQQRKILDGKPSWFARFLTPQALGLEAAFAAGLVAVTLYSNLRLPRSEIGAHVVGETRPSEPAQVAANSPQDFKAKAGLIGARLGERAPSAPEADEMSDGSRVLGGGMINAVGRGQGYAVKGGSAGVAVGAAGAGGAMADYSASLMAGMRVQNIAGYPPDVRMPREGGGTESYSKISENVFLDPTKAPLSTFSINVDTASYANLRRFISGGQLPPKDAVRVEEMVNYFNYNYPEPTGADPFSVTTEVATAPWAPSHRLMKIGLKGKAFEEKKRPATNLVFLVDVSGSMDEPNKLPLLKQSLRMLIDKLDSRDRVSLVTYASGSQVVLAATPGDKKDTIVSAVDRLVAGGSTNGEGGIRLAYSTAQAGFISGGANRVILATDGDFNVGVDSPGDLTKLIEEKAKSGVNLSVLGFGMGNYKDANLEVLSSKGHGNYAYIDTLSEAKKVLVEQMGGTLFTIAKDVKLQLEFNPSEVNGYRLIGYENRLLAHEDFNNDQKAANDIGAGHTVTAIYEIIPKGVSFNGPGVDALKYQTPAGASTTPSAALKSGSGELLTVKLRYKSPGSDTSQLLTHVVKDEGKKLDAASVDFRWAASVAGFGMLLRESPNKGNANYSSLLDLAQSSRGSDIGGYRGAMIELMQRAKVISTEPRKGTPPEIVIED